MCMLCIEIAKGKMTAREVVHAAREFQPPEGHEAELSSKIFESYPIEDIGEALGFVPELPVGIQSPLN